MADKTTNISMCPADNWWAIFVIGGGGSEGEEEETIEVKAKVLYFEIEIDTALEITRRRAIVYLSQEKSFENALDVPGFQGLLYEVLKVDPSTRATKEEFLAFLRNSGANFAEGDLKSMVNDGVVRKITQLLIDEQIDLFVSREEI